MFVFNKKYVIGFLLAGSLSLCPVSSYAQDMGDEIIDFSIIDSDLPPQPTQVNSQEMEAESLVVDEIEVLDIADEPSQELAPVVEQAQTDNTPAKVPYSGTYYDTSTIGAGSASGNSTSPRQVDPRYEPGSSFVVVEKTVKANSIPARITAAQRALELGRYTSALELYEQLYRENARNEKILMGLAVAQQQSGFTESAIATYEELLKVDEDNVDAMTNMLGLLKTQYPSVAYRRLRDLWTNNSGNANVASELGLISSSLGRPEEALRYLGIAASLEPDNASHFYNMAVINDRAGGKKNAIELYQKALEVDIAYGAGRSIQREKVYDRLAYLRRL